ncbi:polysaccharide deacetylase family protein [Burkholderia sp. BCC0322]|uniref:polysaccharide deacetylase family protein n=1 Tax=unclassified Burkholderia TaxID=2613784 RepID=UPI00158D9F2D|nr:polysaccharide deacetylase family protein [Burkholderia sp. BCC0322]
MSIRLSFDDGPGPSTLPLLDVLRAASCHATFFLLGQNLAGALDVAARMASDGHPLGNHTHSHAKPGVLADDALIDEIETTDTLIREAYRRAGVPAPDTIPLRLPYGLVPQDNRAGVLTRLQREHTGWTAILDDWQRPAPSPQALFDAMCAHVDASAARQRDVLFCLHDGSRHGEARPNTVEAVRLFLNRSR